MRNYINKVKSNLSKNKILYLVGVFLVIILVIFYSFFQNQLSVDKKSSEQKIKYSDQSAYSVLTSSYSNYRNKYAASSNKTIGRNLITYELLGNSNPNAESLVKEVNGLKVRLDIRVEDYNAIINCNCLRLFDIETNQDWRNINRVINITNTDRYTQTVINDIERIDRKEVGALSPLYSYSEIANLKLSSSKVINVGYAKNYVLKEGTDELTYYNEFQSSNELIENMLKNNKEYSELKFMSYERFKKNISVERVNSLYFYPYIGGTVAEEMSIEELGLDQNSEIIINEIGADYIYINEASSIVPLIRLDGHATGSKGQVKITFWNWFIELENESDTD